MERNNNIKSIAWLIIISAAMLFSCSEELPVVSIEDPGDDVPTISVEDLRTTYTEIGKTKMKIQATLMNSYTDAAIEPYMDFPKGISIAIHNEEGQIETSATAKRAIYYNNKESWEAIGNVIMSNIKGDVLRTEKLYGDTKSKKIFTNAKVVITKADGTKIVGKSGFESNFEFTKYKFRNVDGIVVFRDEFMENPGQQEIKSTPETKSTTKKTPDIKAKKRPDLIKNLPKFPKKKERPDK